MRGLGQNSGTKKPTSHFLSAINPTIIPGIDGAAGFTLGTSGTASYTYWDWNYSGFDHDFDVRWARLTTGLESTGIGKGGVQFNGHKLSISNILEVLGTAEFVNRPRLGPTGPKFVTVADLVTLLGAPPQSFNLTVGQSTAVIVGGLPYRVTLNGVDLVKGVGADWTVDDHTVTLTDPITIDDYVPGAASALLAVYTVVENF